MRQFCVYAASLFETMISPSIRLDLSLQNFKRPLDILTEKRNRQGNTQTQVLSVQDGRAN